MEALSIPTLGRVDSMSAQGPPGAIAIPPKASTLRCRSPASEPLCGRGSS